MGRKGAIKLFSWKEVEILAGKPGTDNEDTLARKIMETKSMFTGKKAWIHISERKIKHFCLTLQ